MTCAASPGPPGRPEPPSPARERLVEAAYDLFTTRGIQAVGIGAIIERSGVARMTLYRNFASKGALALAALRRREERWTNGWLRAEVERRAADPGERLLTIFDVFDEWFQDDAFEGCTFVNVLLEIPDRGHDLHLASREHLARIRAFVEGLAEEAGVRDPAHFAAQWHILMKGAIVAAAEGDRLAAKRAQAVAALLLDASRAVPRPGSS